MKSSLKDKFLAVGALAGGLALLAVPFVAPEAFPALPLAFAGFVGSASFANKKLGGKIDDIDPSEESGFNNHGITKEDAIESMLAIRTNAINTNVATKPQKLA